jgi:hypothetical protein
LEVAVVVVAEDLYMLQREAAVLGKCSQEQSPLEIAL